MESISLEQRLARRWMAFATILAIVFTAFGTLATYIVEDAVIDRRLSIIVKFVAESPQKAMEGSNDFVTFPYGAEPLDIHARIPTSAANYTFEIRRSNGRYAHVALVTAKSGDRYVEVYDASDSLVVNRGVGEALLAAAIVAGVLVMLARVLAYSFARSVSCEVSNLSDAVSCAETSDQVRTLAAKQSVLEFRRLLELHAELRQSQEKSVREERQTLAYLAHELRTPLQTARTTLALLDATPSSSSALDRLRRALIRLTRASDAALWLATKREVRGHESIRLSSLIPGLIAEFEPLASGRQSSIHYALVADCFIEAPKEVIEVILSNLLMNAIQHGSPGKIVVSLASDSLTITNPIGEVQSNEGFGYGLEIVSRLLDRIGWCIRTTIADGCRTSQLIPASIHHDES